MEEGDTAIGDKHELDRDESSSWLITVVKILPLSLILTCIRGGLYVKCRLDCCTIVLEYAESNIVVE